MHLFTTEHTTQDDPSRGRREEDLTESVVFYWISTEFYTPLSRFNTFECSDSKSLKISSSFKRD